MQVCDLGLRTLSGLFDVVELTHAMGCMACLYLINNMLHLGGINIHVYVGN